MKLTKSTAGRLLIAAACVAATQAVVWQVEHRTSVASAQVAQFDVTGLPSQIGRWSGTTVELDPKLFQKIGGLSIADRMYRDDSGRQGAAHVVNYALPPDLSVPHDPQVCFPSVGWNILSDNWQTDDHGRRYRLMLVEREGKKSSVAYWYQFGPDVAAAREDFRQIIQRLRWQGKPLPPMCKVLLQVPIEFSQDDAESAIRELGAGIYDWIKKNS